jgi:hypothetical protein
MYGNPEHHARKGFVKHPRHTIPVLQIDTDPGHPNITCDLVYRNPTFLKRNLPGPKRLSKAHFESDSRCSAL